MEKNPSSFITDFFKMESAGGIILMLAALAAILAANSAFEPYYRLLLSTPVEIRIGGL